MREGGYEGPVVEDMNAEVGWKAEGAGRAGSRRIVVPGASE